MKTTRLYHSLLLAAAFAALLLATAMAAPRAHAADDRNTATIAFSDPAKPGSLRVIVKTGDITITGTDNKAIIVHTDLAAKDAPPRKDGLRVISESATFTLTEKDNIVTLDTGNDAWLGAGSDAGFEIEVPHNTSVVVSDGFGGETNISNLTGDIEVKSLNGEITLNGIAGSALVETINGGINATVSALHEGKPLSFTSMNGEINIHVPATAKANIRLRTQNGAILTDFDAKALVTRAESVRGGGTNRITVNAIDDSEIKMAAREAARAGAEAAREAVEAMREAAQAAREAAQTERAGANPTVPPIPPVPPVPPMTGGKLVSGTLNGGGPEIYAAAMNGDVTLRRSK